MAGSIVFLSLYSLHTNEASATAILSLRLSVCLSKRSDIIVFSSQKNRQFYDHCGKHHSGIPTRSSSIEELCEGGSLV